MLHQHQCRLSLSAFLFSQWKNACQLVVACFWSISWRRSRRSAIVNRATLRLSIGTRCSLITWWLNMCKQEVSIWKFWWTYIVSSSTSNQMPSFHQTEELQSELIIATGESRQHCYRKTDRWITMIPHRKQRFPHLLKEANPVPKLITTDKFPCGAFLYIGDSLQRNSRPAILRYLLLRDRFSLSPGSITS